MGGELNRVSPTALKETARRSAPAQPTIIQIVRYLYETPMFGCAEAAHKKTSKTLALMCLEKTIRGTNPDTGFCQCGFMLSTSKNRVKLFICAYLRIYALDFTK